MFLLGLILFYLIGNMVKRRKLKPAKDKETSKQKRERREDYERIHQQLKTIALPIIGVIVLIVFLFVVWRSSAEFKEEDMLERDERLAAIREAIEKAKNEKLSNSTTVGPEWNVAGRFLNEYNFCILFC